MSPAVTSLLTVLATAANEEFVPANDWRGVVALPAGIIFFFGGVFLLLKSNLGTRRAYLVEASAFFGFMLILSLFWAFGAPGTPRYTGPQNLPGQVGDYYTPKWVAFAGDSSLADERFGLVKQFPEGFEQVGGDAAAGDDATAGAGGAAEDEGAAEPADPAGGADEVGTFFREERGGTTLIGDNWVLVGSPYLANAEDGTEVVAATYARPFALNDEGEIPAGPNGQPLFTEDQVGQAIPQDFQVPAGVDDQTAEALAPASFTGFAFFDEGFPVLPSLVFVVLSLIGFVLHVLLLGWDENREKERTVEEVIVEREPVRAGT